MRVTYRYHNGNRSYWQSRWERSGLDTGRLNLDRYPGKFAQQAIACRRPPGPVLEAGCGMGRVLLHYHAQGIKIVGLEFIVSALEAIRKSAPELELAAADASSMPFADSSFSAVLAFGLYHNMEHGPGKALAETRRILKRDGVLCASFRLDNIQNRVLDYINRQPKTEAPPSFHKINFTSREAVNLVSRAGFEPFETSYVENMNFLYKFRMLRHKRQRDFQESKARSEGYLLAPWAASIQRFLVRSMPSHFTNVIVVLARAV